MLKGNLVLERSVSYIMKKDKIYYEVYKKEAHLDGKEITAEDIQEIKNNQTENIYEKEKTIIVPTMMRTNSEGDIEKVKVEPAMYEVKQEKK